MPGTGSPEFHPEDLRADRQPRLQAYGWVDRKKGIARMPIDAGHGDRRGTGPRPVRRQQGGQAMNAAILRRRVRGGRLRRRVRQPARAADRAAAPASPGRIRTQGRRAGPAQPAVQGRGVEVRLARRVHRRQADGAGAGLLPLPDALQRGPQRPAAALKAIPDDVGSTFNVVVVSFDPREKPPLAALKKASYTERYDRPGSERGWHFLTGESLAIEALAKAVGFRYEYDPDTQQYAHGSGLVVLAPDGTIARYLLGIRFEPRDLRLALAEASEGKVGSPADQVMLLCYRYDPTTGKYTPAVLKIVRLASAVPSPSSPASSGCSPGAAEETAEKTPPPPGLSPSPPRPPLCKGEKALCPPCEGGIQGVATRAIDGVPPRPQEGRPC